MEMFPVQGNEIRNKPGQINSQAVFIARAVPIAEIIGRDVKLLHVGPLLRGLCPFHVEKTPSFYILDGNHYHCFGCGAHGDVIEYVMRSRRLGFFDAVAELVGARTSTARVNPSATTRPSSRDHVAVLWQTANHPSLAEFYLASRGISLRPKPLPVALRAHTRVWCAETREHRPAVLAAVSELSGPITALQRIWCERTYVSDAGRSPEKGCRGRLDTPKKTIGKMGAGAVQLFEPRDRLGLAEGVETALACYLMFRMPVWATLGAARLGAVAIPDGVRQIIIFGDAGEIGGAQADRAISTYRQRGYRAEAIFPTEPHPDFCAELAGRTL